MKWAGINRKSTPADETQGVDHYLENARLLVNGEKRRRHGMARANIAKLATPIYGIASALAPVPSICLQGSTGSIDGFTSFNPLWGDVQLLAPTGTAVASSGYITGDGNSSGTMTVFAASGTGTSETWWSTTSPGTMTGGLINSGGTNGNFYRVTITIDVIATLNWGTDVYYVASTAGTPLVDGTGYGWILQSNSSSLTLSSTPSDNNFFGQTTVAAAAQFTMTTRYRTAGGAVFPFGTSNFGISVFRGGFIENINNLSGTASVVAELESASTNWTITVNRGSDQWAESYDIYAKDGAYPADPSDGTYIGNIPIDPSASSCTDDLAAPSSSTSWKWVAVPRRGSLSGPMGLLT